MLTPRPYQEAHIREALEYVGPDERLSALIADPMGIGKTLTAAEIVKRLMGTVIEPPALARVLVVAPLNTHDGWEATIRSQMPGADVFVHPRGGRTKAAELWWERVSRYQPGWYLIGWEAMRGMPDKAERIQRRTYDAFLDQMGMTKPKGKDRINRHWAAYGRWSAVIADEIHRAANWKSTTHASLRTIVSNVRLALSGTPAGNRVEGYFGSLQWLWPERYTHFWPWAMQFCDTVLDDNAGRRVLGEKEPGAIVADLPLYLRHELSEVMPDLPEVIEKHVDVPLKGGMQSRVYGELEQDAFTWLEEHPLSAELPITLSMRLRQAALAVPAIVEREVPVYKYRHPQTGLLLSKEESEQAWLADRSLKFARVYAGTETVKEVEFEQFEDTAKSNKIDAMLDILKDIPEHEPVLILTHSAKFTRPVIYQINKSNIGPAVGWTGQTSAAGRARIKADFGRPGGPRFIVAGIAAIGEGTDGLQKVCSHEIWLSQHDNNMLNQQAAARLRRGGQERPVQRWLIRSKGTIDVKVYERLQGNAKQMQAAYRKENPR